MSFLKNIFSRTETTNRFPEETSDGKIEIINNEIICTGKQNIHNCKVNIDDLQYAYIIANRNKESLLFLFDFHQNYLPTNFSGFGQVYAKLSKQLGFDDNVFFKNVNSKVESKNEIWRLKHPSNFKTLENSNTDYELGFEILSPEKDFISWDTTYDELKENSNVFFEESPYGQKISKFKYPIRIGNLILDDFSSYFDNKRTNVPVLHFYSHCIDSTNSDNSYYEIKERLCKDFSEDNQLFGYERADQNSMSFKVNNILISLVYTYDSDWLFDGGYTSFEVKNQRDYPELLIDSNYGSKIEISSFLELPATVSTSSDYKRNKRVKYRLEKLKSDTPIIWVDDINSKIGFADQTYCQVFEINEIKQFTIQNIRPAKGAGGAYLEINFADNSSSYSVLNGACKIFDDYKENIKALTGLEVNMAPEYHDC